MSLDSLLWAAVGGCPSKSQNKELPKNNIENSQHDLKFLFVGGKGGVGKTTSSSAIATLFATKCKKRVLLVSTDPAHSLSDAFRCKFSNVPMSPGIPNLDVMEVDPSDTMKGELEKWSKLADAMTDGENGTGANDMITKISQFQEWLSGVPGIDEATALASAIRWIESGDYDLIVFDTAPTGHTLKLLQMPDILQAGIERLQSWQGKLWGVLEVMKGIGGSKPAKNRANARNEISKMLEEYKQGVQKVALMLQDQQRTRFTVVCIAEYLSISETRRLLQELKKNRVRTSHIIVNQLVVHDALSGPALEELESLAETGALNMDQKLLEKTIHACRLTTSRKAIQEKYLAQLKSFPETQDLLDDICEVPLLPEEVTGCEALKRFGNLMVRLPPNIEDVDNDGVSLSSSDRVPVPLYNVQPSSTNEIESACELPFQKGDVVTVIDLAKAAHYNSLEGAVVSGLNLETGRYGIEVKYNGSKKTLALQQKNIALRKRKKEAESHYVHTKGAEETTVKASEENVGKAKKILEDPEIKAMIDENPRFGAAVEDVMSNPMNFMKYLGDPEMSPLIQKAMGKLNIM